MNLVILHGHIGHMNEVKHVGQNNTAILEFSLATVEHREREKYTTWHNCKAFGTRAETIAKFFSKGSEILLQGRVEQEKWDAKDGSKRSRTSVIINNFEFCGKKTDGAGASKQASAPRNQAEAAVDEEPSTPPAQEERRVDESQPDDDDLPF